MLTKKSIVLLLKLSFSDDLLDFAAAALLRDIGVTLRERSKESDDHEVESAKEEKEEE